MEEIRLIAIGFSFATAIMSDSIVVVVLVMIFTDRGG